MADFVGLRVRATLVDGQAICGTIAAVEQERNSLILNDASIAGGRVFPRLEVSAEQISAVDVLGAPGDKDEPRQLQTWQQKQQQDPKRASPKKGKKNAGHYTSLMPQAKGESSGSDWAEVPPTDFDFVANLGRFDKARVFSDIRSSDAVRPEDRLVAHNQRKLHHTERVLAAPSRDLDEDNVQLQGESIAPIDAVARLMAAHAAISSTGAASSTGATQSLSGGPVFDPAIASVSLRSQAPQMRASASVGGASGATLPMGMQNALPAKQAGIASLDSFGNLGLESQRSSASLTAAMAKAPLPAQADKFGSVTPKAPIVAAGPADTLSSLAERSGPIPGFLGAAEIATLETRLMIEHRLTGLQIAEYAGRSLCCLVSRMRSALGPDAPAHVLIVAAPGRDGAVAAVCARLLRKMGVVVDMVAAQPKVNAGHWADVFSTLHKQALLAGMQTADDSVYFDENTLVVLAAPPSRSIGASVAAAGALLCVLGVESAAGRETVGAQVQPTSFPANILKRAHALAFVSPPLAEAQAVVSRAPQAVYVCDPGYTHASLPDFACDGVYAVAEP